MRRTDSHRTCSTGTCWPRPRDLVADVTAQLDAYDIARRLRSRCATYLDALTNWYVRRSRDRFWAERRPDAFDTLYTVLETLRRVLAPLLPLIAEEIWRGLTGGRSVHLTDWPDAGRAARPTTTLVAAMDAVREVCSAALSLRKAEGLRVRLPLRALTVAAPDAGRAGGRSPTWSPTRSTSRRSLLGSTTPASRSSVSRSG